MDPYRFGDYTLSVGRQGQVLFIMHTHFSVSSFHVPSNEVIGRSALRQKIVCFANCVFTFKFFFPGIRQPRDAHLFKEKYHVLH